MADDDNDSYDKENPRPVYWSIAIERLRQEQDVREGKFLSCADPRVSNVQRLAVLAEEFGDVAREACDQMAVGAITVASDEKMRADLISTAAVCVAWVEAIDGRVKHGDDGRIDPRDHALLSGQNIQAGFLPPLRPNEFWRATVFEIEPGSGKWKVLVERWRARPGHALNEPAAIIVASITYTAESMQEAFTHIPGGCYRVERELGEFERWETKH